MAMRSANVIRLIISCFLQSVTKSIIASSDCKGERQVNSDFEAINMMFNFAIKDCKYHIVFAPKYRRKVFYFEKRQAIGKILRQLCEWKGVKIIAAEACPDHIHIFAEIPPKMSVSHFMGYLKGKSSTMLYEQFGELKYK